MQFVQEDGSEYGVVEEATEVRRMQSPVVKGISARHGDGPNTPDSVGGEGVVDRGAVHGQQEGLITPEDEDSPGSGRAVALGMTPLGEPGREPPKVVGAKLQVERARKDRNRGNSPWRRAPPRPVSGAGEGESWDGVERSDMISCNERRAGGMWPRGAGKGVVYGGAKATGGARAIAVAPGGLGAEEK